MVNCVDVGAIKKRPSSINHRMPPPPPPPLNEPRLFLTAYVLAATVATGSILWRSVSPHLNSTTNEERNRTPTPSAAPAGPSAAELLPRL